MLPPEADTPQHRLAQFLGLYLRLVKARSRAEAVFGGYGPNIESAQQEAFEIKRQLTRIADTVQQDLDAARCGRLELHDAPALGGTVREASLVQAVIHGVDADYNVDPQTIALGVEQAIARHDAGTASRSPGTRRRKKPTGGRRNAPSSLKETLPVLGALASVIGLVVIVLQWLTGLIPLPF